MSSAIEAGGRKRATWRKLSDGRDGLYDGETCVAAISHDPDKDPPFSTESWSFDGVRSLRNLATLAEAREHCERVALREARGTPP